VIILSVGDRGGRCGPVDRGWLHKEHGVVRNRHVRCHRGAASGGGVGDGDNGGACLLRGDPGGGGGGGDDRGLRLAKEPLDGLPVGAVAELTGELGDTGRDHGQDVYTAAAAGDLGVPVASGSADPTTDSDLLLRLGVATEMEGSVAAVATGPGFSVCAGTRL
jgi:hypothetical protein